MDRGNSTIHLHKILVRIVKAREYLANLGTDGRATFRKCVNMAQIQLTDVRVH